MTPPLGTLAYLDVGTADFDRDCAYYATVLGAERVFQKPFAFTEVVDTLRRMANSTSRRRQDRWIDIPLQRSAKDVGVGAQAG